MSIKADRWIQQMATEHGMIEPFVADQVRGGQISYGLSSYGYDMRIADEFKVFTNIYNTLVDPKQFDNRSFVDFNAPYIDIPPNSFALGRSIEYFRIPRNVLCIVLGKSTYARCFSGDTRVALVDGTSVAFADMAERASRGEHFWGYSIGQHGRVIVTLLDAPRLVGRDSLLEIELDNGETIRATPDHEFVGRDGRLVQAAALRPGASLMPLYRDVFRGYEMVYQPIIGYYEPTHRLADEWNVRAELYIDAPDTDRHHIDHNRRNNSPTNLIRMNESDHARYHNREYYDSDDFNPIEHGESIRAAFERLSVDEDWIARMSAAQRARVRAFWEEPRYANIREQLISQRVTYWSDTKNRDAQRERQQVYWENEDQRAERAEFSRSVWEQSDLPRRERQREIARAINIRSEIDADQVRAALDKTGSIRGTARLLECDRSVFRRFPQVIDEFRGTKALNHKVVSVRAIPGSHDVYCLTVPEAGNFALEAGVFVKNCGLIVNVTPLEPAWEGYVTIEVSNTTQLPARVYANEGIAQVLFLESDEQCMTSYADKAGKYQGQVGVVPPRL